MAKAQQSKKSLISSEFYVEGMHCAACEFLIEKKIGAVDGVDKVDAKLSNSKLYIKSTRELSPEELSPLVESDGYKIVSEKSHDKNIQWKELGIALLIAIVIVMAFLLVQKLGIVDLVQTDSITLPFIFMIGVVASLSTCMAVVGGLVLSISSSYSKGHQIKPLIAFHISRLVGFFVLGGVIGLIGSAFILTPVMAFVMNLILFFVMIVMGINLLEVLPFAKNLQIKLPKSIGKNILKLQGSTNILTPILLGLATFVLPCGFTQSMQVYSLSTGNFLQAALTMFVFALGTFPVLALISFASHKFSKTLQSGIFFKTAGLIIIFFAIFNFLSGLAALGLVSLI